jgi:hypothetical protein
MRRLLQVLFICFCILKISFGQEIATQFKIADGQINASVFDAATQKTYVAGDFTAFGNPNSAFLASQNSVGSNIENVLPSVNGQVNKIIQDGSNIYIVGRFYRVNGQLRMGIVRLNAAKQVDMTFNPAIDFLDTSISAGNEINDIAISGNTIVVSGKFRTFNALKRIALINKVNGSVYAWSPELSAFNSTIHCIKVYNNQLYVGGSFNLTNFQLSGSTPIRTNLAIFNISNPNAVVLSNIKITLKGNTTTIYTMESIGSTLYVGGNFDGVGLTSLSDVFAMNMDLGTVITGFNVKITASSTSYVASISAITSNQIFIGGSFTTNVSNNVRSNFILVNSTGSINVNAAFNIALRDQTIIRQITSVNTGSGLYRIFINGPFNLIAGSNRIYQGMLAYNFNVNSSSFSIANNIINGTAGPVNSCIKELNGNYILGGAFSFAGGTRCPHLAVFNSNGTLDMTYTNSFLANSNGDISIKTICLSGSNLYVGGSFKSTNSSSTSLGRSDLMKLSKITLSTDLSFPQLDVSASNSVNVITADGANLYIGGKFKKYILSNGVSVAKNNFFAWNSSNNSAINYNGDLQNGQVNDIAFNSSSVFVGGTFNSPIAGNSAAIAKFSKSTLGLQPLGLNINRTAVSALKIINSNLFVSEGSSVYCYDILSNILKTVYSSTSSNTPLNSLCQVSPSLFIAGGNGSKLYYASTSYSSSVLQVQMSEDVRVSSGYRLLNYVPSIAAIFGVYRENSRYDLKGFTTVFGNGKNTFISINNNLLPPAPPAPTVPSTLLNFVPAATSIKLTWTPGNGSKRIVLARKNADPIIPTTIPSSITASSTFGSGTNIGNATFCIYDGAGSEVILTGLQILSDYRFTILEYNLSNTVNANSAIRTYNTTNNAMFACSTLDYSAPSASISITNQTLYTSSVSFTYTPGNGFSRMCVLKEGANSIRFTPVNGQTYFNGQVLSDSSYVVFYDNINQPLVINNLSSASTYSIAFFEYNLYSGVGPRYIKNPLKLSFTTLDFAPQPNLNSTNLNATNITKTSATINWTKGSGNRRVAFITKSPFLKSQFGDLNFFPNWGYDYVGIPNLANAIYQGIGGGIFNTGTLDSRFVQIIYHDNGSFFTLSNLTPGTTYQIALFESNGSNSQVSYSSNAVDITFSTLPNINPPSQTTNNHSIIVSQDDAKLTWSGGNGNNSIVFIRKDIPVNFIPSNDINYNVNSVYGNVNALYTNGNYAVYTGASSGNINITNLEPDAEYHFAVYDYNTQLGEFKYNPNPYRGIFKTAKAWPIRAGGIKKDAGGGIVTDAQGNVYVAGAFEQLGSWGTKSIPAYGSIDIFMAKYSASGKPIWVLKQGGSSADAGSSISMDIDGNLIMTGSFRGTGTFGQGNILTSNGIDDIFLSKVNPSGDVIWSKRAGGTDQDVAYAITTDNSGNIYLAGYFRGTITFPNSSISLISNGGTDALIAKYDSSGNILWAKSGGGSGNDFAYGVSINGNNVAMVGQFDGASSFSGTSLLSSGLSDIFIAEYAATNGTLNWVKKYGGTGVDIGFSIATAQSDYVITGQFSAVMSAGSTTLNAVGNSDILIARIASNGQEVWLKRAGGVSQDAGRGITVNSANDKLFVTGSFAETALFGSNSLTSFGNLDIFVATVDFATGNFETVFQNGGPADDEARGITANLTNSSFVTGYFNGQGSFGNVDLTSAGDWDIFVHKFTLVIAPELSNGMVAWYKMNGNANDASGNGNNGIALNITPTTNRTNDANSAYQFQSAGQIDVLKVDPINVAGSPTTTTSTLLAWIKTPPNYSNTTLPKPIFSTSIDDIEYRSIQLSDLNTISYSYFNPNTSLQVDQTSPVPIQDNTWHHIAVVFKTGIELIFYLDGNEIGRKSISSFYETENLAATHWNIGHITYADRNTKIYSFNGAIDDMRIFRRALSSSEINSIKNQSTTLAKNELVFAKKSENASRISLWPNPNSGVLNVNFADPISDLKIRLVDISGKEVFSKNYLQLNRQEISIELQNIDNGYYFIQFEADGKIETNKLVISK